MVKVSKEIFNSKETLLAAGSIITIAEKVHIGDITNLLEIEDEKIQEIVKNGMEYHKSNADKVGEIVGATAGASFGVVGGLGLISFMAVEGTAGAAVITSGLAAIGTVIGGGMLAGIGILLVIPAALAAVGGFVGLILSSKSKSGRNKAKLRLIEKSDKLLKEFKSNVKTLGELDDDFAVGVLLILQALNNDLKRDLQ